MVVAMTRNSHIGSNCAAKKMRELGFKRLRESIRCNLATIYKWAGALDEGRGIRDEAKRRLMDATSGTPHAISWSDFDTRVSG